MRSSGRSAVVPSGVRLFLVPGILGLGAAVAPLSASQSSIAQMVVTAANQYGVPPELALGIAAHESGFNPNATNHNTNGTTDWGVMQLNDTTVQTLGVADPLDPQQNINAGVSLLAKYLQQYNGDQTQALWAYASGPGAVSAGSMNSVASSFVNSVESYQPPDGLDLGDASAIAPVDDSGGAVDDATGYFSFLGSVDPVYLGLGAAALGLLLLTLTD